MTYIISFDVGGTNIRAGIVNDGKVLLSKTASTPKGKAILNVISSLIASLSTDAKCNEKIQAVCLGFPGAVRNGKITWSNGELKDYPVVHELQKRFNEKKLQFYLENDANCFALAAANYGAGKKYKNVYCITLGTGMGGSLVIDKQLYKGAGNASHICYMSIHFNGIKDELGNYGAFEEYCSARGILRIAKEHKLNVETPLDVYNLAKKHNNAALASWKEYGFYLGVGITNIINLLNPDVIILGGGLSNAWPYFKKEMFKTIKERALFKETPVVQSKLKDAGLLGASLLLKD